MIRILKSSVFALHQFKNYLPQTQLLMLYHAFVRSHINYIIPFLGMASNQSIQKINNLDRQALRAVFGISMRDSISHKYTEHTILTLHQLINLYKCKIMYRVDHNQLGGEFDLFWHKNTTRQGSRELRNHNHYQIPQRISYESLKRSPLISFPYCYNNLPNELKILPKLRSFTTDTKRFLFTNGGGDLVMSEN